MAGAFSERRFRTFWSPGAIQKNKGKTHPFHTLTAALFEKHLGLAQDKPQGRGVGLQTILALDTMCGFGPKSAVPGNWTWFDIGSSIFTAD